MLPLQAVYETVLYHPDHAGAKAFYGGVLSLRQVSETTSLSCAFRLPDGGMLLIFDPAASIKAGRGVPSHGATGPGHVALRVPTGGLDEWRDHLVASGVAVEQEITWKTGARSIYVRDGAGPGANSVELVEGEIWAL